MYEICLEFIFTLKNRQEISEQFLNLFSFIFMTLQPTGFKTGKILSKNYLTNWTAAPILERIKFTKFSPSCFAFFTSFCLLDLPVSGGALGWGYI